MDRVLLAEVVCLDFCMPTRLIREGILTSDAVNSLSAKDEVFYRRLLSIVDDYGRYDARIAIVRAQLYPLQLDQIRESDVVRGLAACEKASLVRCYKVEGKPYLQVEKFGQQVRAKTSKWPDPITDDNRCKQMHAPAHSVGDEDEDEDGCVVEDGKRGGAPVRSDSPDPEIELIPPELDAQNFHDAWDRWHAYRREAKLKSWVASTRKIKLNQLAKLGADHAITAIDHSIANGYQGIFEPGGKGSGGGGQTPQSRAEARRAEARSKEHPEDSELTF